MQEIGASNQTSSEEKVYVPPHLRRLRESAKDGSTGGNIPVITPIGTSRVYKYESIQKHFWPVGEDRNKDDGEHCEDGGRNTHITESTSYRNGARTTRFNNVNTLHDSAEKLGKLAYITLFPEGNPRWENDGIIFVKSNLELLKPYQSKAETTAEDFVVVEAEKTPTVNTVTNITTTTTLADRVCNDQTASNSKTDGVLIQKSQSIPVFMYERKHAKVELFSLVGHFRISRVDLLEPHSEELQRMMKQKWESPSTKTKKTKRDMSRWNESFSRHWAVVQLVPAAEEEEEEEEDYDYDYDKDKGMEKERGEEEEAVAEADKDAKNAEQQEGNVREGKGLAGNGQEEKQHQQQQQQQQQQHRPGGSLNVKLEEKLEPYDFEYSRVNEQLRRMRMADDEVAPASASA